MKQGSLCPTDPTDACDVIICGPFFSPICSLFFPTARDRNAMNIYSKRGTCIYMLSAPGHVRKSEEIETVAQLCPMKTVGHGVCI